MAQGYSHEEGSQWLRKIPNSLDEMFEAVDDVRGTMLYELEEVIDGMSVASTQHFLLASSLIEQAGYHLKLCKEHNKS